MSEVLQHVLSWLQVRPWVLGPVCYLVTVLLLFWLRPLWLLKLDEVFSPATLRIPLLNVELSLRSLLLLQYRPRVLDRWVARHLDVVNQRFSMRKTVEARKDYVPLQVRLDQQLLPELQPQALREIFASKRICLLIQGEGGTGKTSLACQIARWGLAGRELGGHRMLPVLIEQELNEGPRSFEEAIRGQLRDLTAEAEISQKLLEALLRHRRVLVIVDRFSELSERTRKQVQPGAADFPVHALIVTSRIEEELGVSTNILRPGRIAGNRLSAFMDAYLELRGKRELLADDSYFEACRHLSQMVAGRKVTALLARMYAEQLIATLEETAPEEMLEGFAEKLPGSIPDLMRCYVSKLNRSIEKGSRRSEREIQQDAELIAWECVKDTLHPQPASREAVLKALATRAGDAETRLGYLEERLQLVRTDDPGDMVRFGLDPLAEYLAGLYLVKKYGENEKAWLEFLDDAKARLSMPQQSQGFMVALRDCYLAKVPDATESSRVPQELAGLAGLDPVAIQRAQRLQRIRRLISSLTVPDAEDRLQAALVLHRMGAARQKAVAAVVGVLRDSNNEDEVRIKAAEALGTMWRTEEARQEAVPTLIEALKDSNKVLRWKAAEVLRKMGKAGQEAVPTLIEALKDSDTAMRVQATEALGRMGEAGHEAVPALIQALKDSDTAVRVQAAEALGRMGETGGEVAPALIEAVRDSDAGVRWAAVMALGRMGEAGGEVVPALIEAVKDSDAGVRWAAAMALGRMGEAGGEAVSALIDALKDSDAGVRGAAAEALGRMGEAEGEVAPALMGTLKDPDAGVRWAAVMALGRLGEAGEAAVSALLEVLEDSDAGVRWAAAETLRNLRAAGVEAMRMRDAWALEQARGEAGSDASPG